MADLTRDQICELRCKGGCKLFDGTEKHDICADEEDCALARLRDMALRSTVPEERQAMTWVPPSMCVICGDPISICICKPDPAWDSWWAKNHPWDWWAKDLGGLPVNTTVRLLVNELAKRAYYAGKQSAANVIAKEK